MKEETRKLNVNSVYALVKKIYITLKKENKPVEEKFAASILYAKILSDYNNETTEDFLTNVALLTADESVFKDAAKQIENAILYQKGD